MDLQQRINKEASDRGLAGAADAQLAVAACVLLGPNNEVVFDGRDPAASVGTAGAMGVVVHGATAGTPRPTGFMVVTWVGSVEPTNAINNDIWEDVS